MQQRVAPLRQGQGPGIGHDGQCGRAPAQGEWGDVRGQIGAQAQKNTRA